MTKPRSYSFNTELSPNVIVVESYDSPNLASHNRAALVSQFPNVMDIIKIVRDYLTTTAFPQTLNEFLMQLSRQVRQAAHTLILARKMKGTEPTPEEVLSFLSNDFPIIHFAELQNVEGSGDRGLWGFVDTALGPSIYLDAGLCRGYEELCGISPPKDCKLTQNDLFFLFVTSLLHELSHSLSWRFLNRYNTRLDEGESDDPESGKAFEDTVFGGSFAVVWKRNGDKGQILKAVEFELRNKSNKRFYKVTADELKVFRHNLVHMKPHFRFQLNGTSSCAGAKIRTRPFHGDEIVAEDEEETELTSMNQPFPPTPADSDDEGRFYVTTHCTVAARRMNSMMSEAGI
ncbi:hypothetical protein BT96DRAFT_972787 [Gymnopus androsaceus JB14]|uniref:Uncharacterized protein n=1 Tax=Gymnopus androsaceus JB14 TaxID=1447944 RepID=A0A6A4I4Y1_9AGAR|nr:hypothetical protein BT96DRAFT_972787 [Gymnopus androsaceus JB14]